MGKSVTHKAPTPVQRFTKSNVAQLPGFGSSSFEAAFNVKIGGGQSAPGGATPTMAKRPPVRRAPTMRRPIAATASPTTRVPGAAAKRKAPPAMASPPQASNKARRLTALGGTPGSTGKSPAAAAKSPDQGDYATRQNAGKVEASLNAAMKGPADTSGPDSVAVEPLPSVLDHNVKKPYVAGIDVGCWSLVVLADCPTPSPVYCYARYRFMLTPLAERAMALEQRILDMEAAISASGRFPDITPVGVASQAKIIVVGRVCPEGGGRLTRGAILLEGSRRTSNSARVAVDVRELKAYHLFPGQIVALEGMCTTGTRMVAQRVIEVRALGSGSPARLPTPCACPDVCVCVLLLTLQRRASTPRCFVRSRRRCVMLARCVCGPPLAPSLSRQTSPTPYALPRCCCGCMPGSWFA